MSKSESTTSTPKIVVFHLIMGLSNQFGSVKFPCSLRQSQLTDPTVRSAIVNVYLRQALLEVLEHTGKIISAPTYSQAAAILDETRSLSTYGGLVPIADALPGQNSGELPQNLPPDLMSLVDQVYLEYRKEGPEIAINPADKEQLVIAAGALQFLQVASAKVFGLAIAIARADTVDKSLELAHTYGVENPTLDRAFEWARELPAAS
jgi:hypothetical protein